MRAKYKIVDGKFYYWNEWFDRWMLVGKKPSEVNKDKEEKTEDLDSTEDYDRAMKGL